jgi:uncharacterized membrane protein YjgN (DUF898 family)
MSQRVDRARAHLAQRLLAFFAMIAIGGLLYSLFNGVLENSLAYGQNMTDNTTATNKMVTIGQIWDGLPYFILFLAGVMLLAAAVYESNRL